MEQNVKKVSLVVTQNPDLFFSTLKSIFYYRSPKVSEVHILFSQFSTASFHILCFSFFLTVEKNKNV